MSNLDDQQLEELFNLLDRDGDSKVSLEDLRDSLADMDFAMDPEKLMDKVDKTGKGYFSFEEFRRGHSFLLGGGGGSSDEDSNEFLGDDMDDTGVGALIDDITDLLRVGSDGKVSLTELERALSVHFGRVLNDDERENMVSAFGDDIEDIKEGVSMDRISDALEQWMKSETADDPDKGDDQFEEEMPETTYDEAEHTRRYSLSGAYSPAPRDNFSSAREAAIKQQIDMCIKENQDLTEQLNNMRRQCEQQTNEISRLRATVMMRKKSEERAKMELDKSAERELELKSNLERANRAHSDARLRTAELEKELGRLRLDINSSPSVSRKRLDSPRTIAIKAAKGRLVSVEQHQKLKAKLDAALQKTELLVAKVSEKAHLIKRLQATVAQKTKLNSDQKSQLQALKHTIEKESKSKQEVKKVSPESDDDGDHEPEDNPFAEFSEMGNASLMDELAEPEADLVKVHEAEMATAVTDALNEQKQDLETKFENQLDALNAAMVASRAAAETKQQDLSTQHQQELVAMKQQMSDAAAAAATKQQDLSAQNQQELAAMQQQMKAAADSKQQELSTQHRQELAAIKQQMSDAAVAAETKHEDLSAEHQQELAAMQRQMSDAAAAAVTKQQDLSSEYQQELAAMQQKLDQLHRERQQLEQQIEQLETQKAQTLNQHREHLDREQSRLQRMRQQHQVAIDSLTKQLESAMAETTAKAKEVAELQSKLTEAKQNQKPAAIDPEVSDQVSDVLPTTAEVSELEARVLQLQQDNERLVKVQEASDQELQGLRAQHIKHLAAITAADEVQIELDQSQAALQEFREQAKLQEQQHAAAVALLKEQQQTVGESLQADVAGLKEKAKLQEQQHAAAVALLKEQQQTQAHSVQGKVKDLRQKAKLQEQQHAAAVALLKEQQQTAADYMQAEVADLKQKTKLQEQQHAAAVALLKEQQQTAADSLQEEVADLKQKTKLQEQQHAAAVALLKEQQQAATDSLRAEVTGLKEQVETTQALADVQRRAASDTQNRYDTLVVSMQDLRHNADGSQQRALATQNRLQSEVAGALATQNRLQSEVAALANESAASSQLAARFADGLAEVQQTSKLDNEEQWNIAKGVQKLVLSSQNLREQLETTEIELESQKAELSKAKRQVARLRKALTRAQSSMALMPTVIRPWRDNDMIAVPMGGPSSPRRLGAAAADLHSSLSSRPKPPAPPPRTPEQPRVKALRDLLGSGASSSSAATPSPEKSPHIARKATPNTRGMYENVLRRMATVPKTPPVQNSVERRTSPMRERRRRSMSRSSAMPSSHGPKASRGLQKFIATKKRAVMRRRAKINNLTSPAKAGLFRQHAQLELDQLEGFTALAMSQINTFKGDYLEFKKKTDKIMPLLVGSGGKVNEEIVFSSVVSRCLPSSFFGLMPNKRKRTLLITTGAVYELNHKGDKILTRTDYFALNCLSLTTNASDSFALIAPQSFDFLYQSMRRTEIAARLMQCYEAFTGTYLKVRFMKSILLTMENGEVKNTFVDEKSASVKMETYQPKIALGTAQGFICPECLAKFSTAKKLQRHHNEIHCNPVTIVHTPTKSSPKKKRSSSAKSKGIKRI